jgi:hypothetical protein
LPDRPKKNDTQVQLQKLQRAEDGKKAMAALKAASAACRGSVGRRDMPIRSTERAKTVLFRSPIRSFEGKRPCKGPESVALAGCSGVFAELQPARNMAPRLKLAQGSRLFARNESRPRFGAGPAP